MTALSPTDSAAVVVTSLLSGDGELGKQLHSEALGSHSVMEMLGATVGLYTDFLEFAHLKVRLDPDDATGPDIDPAHLDAFVRLAAREQVPLTPFDAAPILLHGYFLLRVVIREAAQDMWPQFLLTRAAIAVKP